MATIALDAYRETRTAETETPGLPEVLDCFAEVIEAIDSEAALDEILHLVARKVCTLVDCSRCGVYLKHSDTGLYRGQVIEPSHEAGDERDPPAHCGTVADRLTQEVLATKEPVLRPRRDQDDRRTVRSIMQTWGVRSILGVPMIVREDVVGMLYLDNEETPHPFTERAAGRGLDVRASRRHRDPAGAARRRAADQHADGRTPERAPAPQHGDRGAADEARARGRHARRHRDRRLGADRQAVRDPRRRLPAPGASAARRRQPSPPRACSTTSSASLPAVEAALAGARSPTGP